MQKHFDNSAAARAHVRQLSGDDVLLAFSRGKDAIGAWLALRASGFRVHPFHMDLVPGLSFVENSIRYYEDFFGVQIRRYMHPSFWRLIQNLVLQSPERQRFIEGAQIYESCSHEDVADDMRRKIGNPDAWVATGVRAVDSPARMMAVRKHGSVNYKRRSFMAVFDWKMDQLQRELHRAQVKLPYDYVLFGRSFDGIDDRFMLPLREHKPDDFAKCVFWYPMIPLELMRRDIFRRHFGGGPT